ncbi:MAG: cysteine desulfurase [Clostridiales bacterium]|nr:cysteine desulfurase [Clostridiales bacterium]
MEAYLDNSATTQLCEEAIAEMTDMLKNNFGNPSSLHKVGTKAHLSLQSAREAVAKKLGCEAKEVYFTSGGTQSNNIAVLGAVNALSRRGKKIVTTAIEHPSVEECMKALEKRGFEVVRLMPENDGKISVEALKNAIDKNTILVSVMAVNNEIGSIQPVNMIKPIIQKAGSPALVHTDCVQAFGKIPVSPSKLGADIISISSHKIHGPKGAGALYVRKGIRLLPEVYGGGQENAVRSGTEPMPAIIGFSAAVNALPDIKAEFEQVKHIRDYFLDKIKKEEAITVNSPEDALPYIINISVEGLRSEPMLNLLSDMGIYVSSGSACAKGHKSKVLESLGFEDDRIDSALRISLSRFTTKQEMDYLFEGIKKCQAQIRKK